MTDGTSAIAATDPCPGAQHPNRSTYDPHRACDHRVLRPGRRALRPSAGKDSCGVGFIADSRAGIAPDRHRCAVDPRQSRASRRRRRRPARRRRRRRPRADPARTSSAQAQELGFKLPEPGHYAVGPLFMPRDTAWRESASSSLGRRPGEGGRAEAARLARRPTDNSTLGETVKPTEPSTCRSSSAAADHQVRGQPSSAASTSCARRSRMRSIDAATRDSPASTRCRCRAARIVYKGMFLADQLGTSTPTCTRRFDTRARADPSALLDQHLPDLVARASLPDDRPQQRDQRAARQRQLDGGAAAWCSRSSMARTSTACGDLLDSSPTPPASTTHRRLCRRLLAAARGGG